MQVCGNLQTLIWAANKHHCHSELAASKNKYSVCWTSLCSEFIIGRVEPASIVLMNPNPRSLPSDLEHSVSGNTQVWPFVSFYLQTKVFFFSIIHSWSILSFQLLCLWIIPLRNNLNSVALLDIRRWMWTRTTNIMLCCCGNSSPHSLSKAEMFRIRELQ